MENKIENKEIKNKEQIITLNNRKLLSITGTEKVVSLKPDLIQLDTVYGGLMITGSGLELIKLDDNLKRTEISGNIDCLRFVEGKSKEPFFRKIFK